MSNGIPSRLYKLIVSTQVSGYKRNDYAPFHLASNKPIRDAAHPSASKALDGRSQQPQLSHLGKNVMVELCVRGLSTPSLRGRGYKTNLPCAGH